MKIIFSILLILFGVLLAMTSTSTSAQTCLVSNPGDSKSFGNALAISDRYLAVGDREANRVVIYSRNKDEKWARTREILPPKGSAAELAGSGFGYSLALDKETLVIGAYNEGKHNFENNNQFKGAIYSTLLGSENINSIKELEIPQAGMIVGYALSIFDNQVAIGGKIKKAEGKWVGNVLILDIVNNKLIKVIEPPTPEAAELFGISLGIYNDVLIVGAPFDPPEGAAWLFDISMENQPIRIAGKSSSTAFAGSSVAKGKDFAAVSVSGESWGQLRTVVKTLKQVPTILETAGQMSAYGNFLAVAQSPTPDGERAGFVSVFDINPQKGTQLVLEIPEAQKVALSDELIVFTIENEQKSSVCYRALKMKSTNK